MFPNKFGEMGSNGEGLEVTLQKHGNPTAYSSKVPIPEPTKHNKVGRVPDRWGPGMIGFLKIPWERCKPFCQQVRKDRPLPGQPPSKSQRFSMPRAISNRVVSHTGPGLWSSIKRGCSRHCQHKETEAIVPSLGSQLPPRSVALSPQP